MKLSDFLLALAITAIWGLNFSVIKIGLDSFDPYLLASLRFVFCLIPAIFFVPRPKIFFGYIIGYGFVLGVLQFGLLFAGIYAGLSSGLASVVLQLQAFFTILLAVLFFREKILPRQAVGMMLALLGIICILQITDGSATIAGILLVIGAAAAWGVANIIAKKSGATDMLPFVVWSSVIPPIPLFIVALWIDGFHGVFLSIRSMDLKGLGAVLYLVYPTTLFGYSAWNRLIKKYKASIVAPLTLLVPVFGIFGSVLIFNESFGFYKVLAITLIFIGLLVSIFGIPSFIALKSQKLLFWRRNGI